MMRKELLLSILLLVIICLSSCDKNIAVAQVEKTDFKIEEPIKAKFTSIHEYGGWSCPDNLRGFPPVNLKDWEQIPVINDRLPTKEETQTGISLMYFDTTEIPDARPLDMKMPRLARYYSDYTKKNELVIAIQAVIASSDTVVGFRYLNGGNGSAWLGEVAFLSDEERAELGSTPFVDQQLTIYAPKEKIWEVITGPQYAKELGEMFDKGAYIESAWEPNAKVHFKYGPDQTVSTGIITALWAHLYIQVDYNFDGYHYAEKFLLLENKDMAISQPHLNNSTQLKIVAGPYGEDYEAQKVVWNNWAQKVKELSEKE